MDALYKFVLFKIDNHHFALDINSIDKISKLVEITPLPNAPAIVIGIINVQGDVMPVVDIRRRLNLPSKEYELNDHLIIGHTEKRSLAILADDIGELIEIQPKRLTKRGDILPGLGPISGAIKLQGDVILIHDLESFLSLDEEKMIDKAMKESRTKPASSAIVEEIKLPEKKAEIKKEEKDKVKTSVKPKKATTKKTTKKEPAKIRKTKATKSKAKK